MRKGKERAVGSGSMDGAMCSNVVLAYPVALLYPPLRPTSLFVSNKRPGVPVLPEVGSMMVVPG